jgi:hypothetical protein
LRPLRDALVRKFGSGEAKAGLLNTPEADKPNVGDRSATIVSVTVLPSAPIGNHSGKLELHTNLADRPKVVVPLYATVLGDIRVVPKFRNLGLVTRGMSKSGTFSINSRKRREFEIEEVENKPEYAHVELTRAASGTSYRLRVSVRHDAPLGKMYGNVILHTNDPDQPEVMVRFNAEVIDK